MKKLAGAKGFSQAYWEANYAAPEEMDGIGNVTDHVGYMKHLFAMEFIDISSIIDYGFGLGHLFEEVLKLFIPYRAQGIEPSEFAYQNVVQRDIRHVASTKLKLEKIDLVSWCQKSSPSKRFDLGLCTSVLQYLSDAECEYVIESMAEQVKYLYLTVPTDRELDQQIADLNFKDDYAIRRSRTKYLKFIKPHFTFVSSRLLESKVHFDTASTHFTDLLFRF